MTMNPLQMKTRAELLATQLEARIANGEFGPGDMIGTMDELKQQSGYARSTVAEAIRLLTDRGAAEVRPGRGGGVYVAADGDPVVRIGRTLLTISGQPSAVADAIAVRKALEPLIVMDATRHRDEADIRELRSILQELANAIPQGTALVLALNWRLRICGFPTSPRTYSRDTSTAECWNTPTISPPRPSTPSRPTIVHGWRCVTRYIVNWSRRSRAEIPTGLTRRSRHISKANCMQNLASKAQDR